MTDTPSPNLPTAAEAAALLVEASAIDVDTDRARRSRSGRSRNDGATVTGSAPRLAVAGGMTVTCRLSHDGQPIQVDAVIEEAEFRSQARASLVLRVVAVATHGYRRRTERLAVSCGRLAAGGHLRPGRARRGHPGDADRPERRRLRDEPDRRPPARAATAWPSRPGSSRASSPPTSASSASTRRAPTCTRPAATSSARPPRAGGPRARPRPARGPRPACGRSGRASAKTSARSAENSLKSPGPILPMMHIGRSPSVPLHAFLRLDEWSEPDGPPRYSACPSPEPHPPPRPKLPPRPPQPPQPRPGDGRVHADPAAAAAADPRHLPVRADLRGLHPGDERGPRRRPQGARLAQRRVRRRRCRHDREELHLVAQQEPDRRDRLPSQPWTTGQNVTVTVTYPYSINLLGFVVASGTLKSTTTVRME